MCEIFCFSSDNYIEINDYLKEFYNHSDEHPHGWGLAILDGDSYVVEKEPVKAKDSVYLKELLSTSITSKCVFSHIRLATMGKLAHENCHPFTRVDDNDRSWILMHNGTIFSYSPLDDYVKLENGDTDSERILLYIVDRVNEFESVKNRKSTVEERFDLISSIIEDIACGNKLNIMIYDGQMIYIHSNFKDSLYYQINDKGFFAASSPLTDDDWINIDLNTVYGIRDGEMVFKSSLHDNEFEFGEEHEEYFRKYHESLGDESWI